MTVRLRGEAHLHTLTDDVVKTSEIEGEHLESDQVRSSIARRLGMDVSSLVPSDRNVDGIVEMMLDETTAMAVLPVRSRIWHSPVKNPEVVEVPAIH